MTSRKEWELILTGWDGPWDDRCFTYTTVGLPEKQVISNLTSINTLVRGMSLKHGDRIRVTIEKLTTKD